MYFYCRNLIRTGDKQLAAEACKEFLAKYPASTKSKQVKQLLERDIPALAGKKGG